MKRIIAMFLALTLLFTSAGEILAAELSTSKPDVTVRTNSENVLTGYVEGEGIGIPLNESDAATVASADLSKFSQVYNHDWDKYSTNYYYNQLSKEEKALWDTLDKLCIYYLEKKDSITKREQGFVLMDQVPVNFKMKVADFHNFWCLFMLSNPQYYYVLNRYFFYYDPSTMIGYDNSTADITSVHLCCYNAFADGDMRATATKKMKKQITAWEEQIETCSNEQEKVKLIHDLVCEKVRYNYDVLYDGVISPDEEEVYYTQTAYSVLCTDTTVCAGYSDAMALMCNGAGLDAVSVTSYDHQWNKVRVDDVWYCYDTTWADTSDEIYTCYEWYARSDARYQQDGNSHVEESFLADYSPAATTDVPPVDPWVGPGTYPKLSKTVETPKIQVTHTDDGYTVKITCATKNAKIYYTTDGKEPGVATSKSAVYKKEFKLKKDATVKAIAVRSGYKDSKIATKKTNAKTTSIAKAKVTLAKTKFYYDGEAKKPKVKSVKLGGKTLKANEDYKVTYKNNKNIGTATVTITGIGDYSGTVKKTFKIVAAVGETFTSSNNKYEVTGSSTVAFTGIKKSKTTVTIPSTVKFGGATFKVTKIADNALKGKTKVKEVVVGTNLKEIGKQAFYGCKKLTKITIKSTKLTKVGKNALKSVNSKVKIYVPSKKVNSYKKLFKSKGLKKVTVTKIK
ncbi:MAG: chitobiase/beta-hexosaminidase C-terminal domain-containing protein [Agathobacter sp.]|nr:chitobiase/beta-hexosaminidase C-terminal domain-containing protein [Agathobacter sp.]